MLRRKIKGYDTFACIADKCPATCCAGWLIEIDDEALQRYRKETDAYGKTLRKRIDWEEKVFLQDDRARCAFCVLTICAICIVIWERRVFV